jgi:hypothetical protein
MLQRSGALRSPAICDILVEAQAFCRQASFKPPEDTFGLWSSAPLGTQTQTEPCKATRIRTRTGVLPSNLGRQQKEGPPPMKRTTATHAARTTGASPIAANSSSYLHHACGYSSLRPCWPPPGRCRMGATFIPDTNHGRCEFGAGKRCGLLTITTCKNPQYMSGKSISRLLTGPGTLSSTPFLVNFLSTIKKVLV